MASKIKKVYFLINSLEAGGAERQLVNLCKGLADKYEIKILTLIYGTFYDLPPSVKIESLSKSKNKSAMILELPKIIKNFKKILAEEKPDAVMSSLEPANFINLKYNPGKKIISVEVHLNYFYKLKPKNVPYKLLIDSLYKRADIIKVNSDENKHFIAKTLKIDPKKIKVIYNPVDLEKIKVLRKEKIGMTLKKTLQGKKVYVTVGRFIPHKKFDLLIKGFKKIHEKNKKSVLLLVGYGPDEAKLKALANKLKLNKNVIFLGKQKNVFKFLEVADYFIYASKIEGFPNVLVEAISMNLPIITSHFESGALEVIDPNNKNYFKKLKYPHYGTNGVIVDLKHYEEQVASIDYSKLRHEMKGVEMFKIENVQKEFEKEILKNGWKRKTD